MAEESTKLKTQTNWPDISSWMETFDWNLARKSQGLNINACFCLRVQTIQRHRDIRKVLPGHSVLNRPSAQWVKSTFTYYLHLLPSSLLPSQSYMVFHKNGFLWANITVVYTNSQFYHETIKNCLLEIRIYPFIEVQM